MENSDRFFRNTDCRYFPCHQGLDPRRFNCLFCYCPLYLIRECGGNFRLTSSGIKDCSSCLRPHEPEGYDAVLAALRAAMGDAK